MVVSEKLIYEMLNSLAHILLLIGSELILVEGFNTAESGLEPHVAQNLIMICTHFTPGKVAQDLAPFQRA